MKCILLGEGETDLGVKGYAKEPCFKKGPMTLVIDFLAKERNVLSINYKFLTRGDVERGLKDSKRKISPRPKDVDSKERSIYLSAWYIGGKAVSERQDAAIYFHDPDRTKSEPRDRYARIEKAMNRGFDMVGFDKGIPMVPVPRSEAWLLAYFQKGIEKQCAYNKAEWFEGLPASDKSPKSAKKELQKAVGARNESETYSKVMEEFKNIDWKRVDMPSYNRFRARLEFVLDAYKDKNQGTAPKKRKLQ